MCHSASVKESAAFKDRMVQDGTSCVWFVVERRHRLEVFSEAEMSVEETNLDVAKDWILELRLMAVAAFFAENVG